jgi:hypothetical protein
MFPRLREQIGTALDLIVEFSTLGEYRLGVDHAHGAPGAPAAAPSHASQQGGAGKDAARAAVRRTVAGGATGTTPVATPAARRLAARAAGALPVRAPRRAVPAGSCGGDRRRKALAPTSPRPSPRRSGPRATVPPEQLCLAV